MPRCRGGWVRLARWKYEPAITEPESLPLFRGGLSESSASFLLVRDGLEHIQARCLPGRTKGSDEASHCSHDQPNHQLAGRQSEAAQSVIGQGSHHAEPDCASDEYPAPSVCLAS